MPKYNIVPNAPERLKAVRGAYLYNLVDCLHTCILRRDLPRARRAWAILVRCPDVNWRDRWDWGLYLLNATGAEKGMSDGEVVDDDADNPYAQPQQAAYSQREPGQDALVFLRDIHLSSKEADKPAVLAEMVLHLIAVGRYRQALEELTTYLLGYPYTLSAPLHTYAGMVCFYLAQPESLRREPGRRSKSPRTRRARRDATADTDDTDRPGLHDSSDSDSSHSSSHKPARPPDANYIRQARTWFTKAFALDPNEAVAQGFINLIDKPAQGSDDEMDVDESFEQSPKPVLSDMDTDSPAVLPAQFPEAGAYYSGSDEEDYEDMRVIPDERITRRRSARISGVF